MNINQTFTVTAIDMIVDKCSKVDKYVKIGLFSFPYRFI
jgi:hypothetical protein